MVSICYELTPGSSRRGLSYYLGLLSCPRRAELDRTTPHRSMDAPLATGVIFHALIELALERTISTPAQVDLVTFSPADHPALAAPAPIEEARRLVRWWLTNLPIETLGSPLGIEVELAADADLCSKLGVPELSGRLDLVSHLDTPTLERLRSDFYLDLPGPGSYIFDHKAVAAARGFTYYLTGHQRVLYPLLWENAGHDPVLGTIFHFVTKTKEPKVIFQYAPPPSPDDLQMLRSTLAGAQRWAETMPNFADSTRCTSYTGQTCAHLFNPCPRF